MDQLVNIPYKCLKATSPINYLYYNLSYLSKVVTKNERATYR